jgi:hypothetical protein
MPTFSAALLALPTQQARQGEFNQRNLGDLANVCEVKACELSL